MSYAVKEVYYTVQGEGLNVGRPAVFVRFAGCNLWSGREHDRSSAVCQFCDTDFVGTNGPGGGVFANVTSLVDAAAALWPEPTGRDRRSKVKPFVVCTGGEPLLQLDAPLVDEFHARDFEVSIETNGTRMPPPGIDWICVSPKAGSTLALRRGNELKLVFHQPGAEPHQFEDLEFDHFWLQPMDGPHVAQYTAEALAYCRDHPRWRLSIQVHKVLRIP